MREVLHKLSWKDGEGRGTGRGKGRSKAGKMVSYVSNLFGRQEQGWGRRAGDSFIQQTLIKHLACAGYSLRFC